MNYSNRRTFLAKAALVTFGMATAASGVSFGENEMESKLRSEDGQLAEVLRSYGRAVKMSDGGFRTLHQGSRKLRLPTTQLQLRVHDQASFCQSFQQIAESSDQVKVEGNTTRIVRGGRVYEIENVVA